MNTNIINAISSKTRRKILLEIKKGEICACKIPKRVNKTQPAVSQHLTVLKKAGLIKFRRKGTMMLYSLTEKGKLVINDIKGW